MKKIAADRNYRRLKIAGFQVNVPAAQALVKKMKNITGNLSQYTKIDNFLANYPFPREADVTMEKNFAVNAIGYVVEAYAKTVQKKVNMKLEFATIASYLECLVWHCRGDKSIIPEAEKKMGEPVNANILKLIDIGAELAKNIKGAL